METIADGLRATGARDVRTNIVRDSGHWPAFEQPDALIAVVREFVDSID